MRPASVGISNQGPHSLSYHPKTLAGGKTIGHALPPFRLDLLLEAGDADFEELIQVGMGDPENFTRSSNGTAASNASSKTRWLNSSHESSRLKRLPETHRDGGLGKTCGVSGDLPTEGRCLRAMSQEVGQTNPDSRLGDSDIWTTQNNERPFLRTIQLIKTPSPRRQGLQATRHLLVVAHLFDRPWRQITGSCHVGKPVPIERKAVHP